MAEDESKTTPDKRITICVTVGQACGLVVVAASIVSGSFGLGWSISNWTSGGKVAVLETTVAERDRIVGDLTSTNNDLKVEHQKLKTKEGVLRLFYFYHVAKFEEESARDDVETAQDSLDDLIPIERPSFPAMAFLPDEVIAMRKARKAEYEKSYREYYESLTNEQRSKVDEGQAELARAKEAYVAAKNKTYEAGEGFVALIHKEDQRAQELDITLAHIGKGGGGTGTIKFAYDDTTVFIPNEFLPKAER